MSMILHREIEKLKKQLLSVGAVVEEALSQVVQSLNLRNEILARQIAASDSEIDRMEVEVEEECLKILALHQPVAADLRFVVAVLKMNNDLERMGDLAANIAKRVVYLATHPPVDLTLDFAGMGAKVQSMVKRSLDALVNYDAALARQVCADDDEVDQMRRDFEEKIKEAIQKNPSQSESLMTLSSVTRHLERLADMATNVAEDVIYMVEGAIIRHRG